MEEIFIDDDDEEEDIEIIDLDKVIDNEVDTYRNRKPQALKISDKSPIEFWMENTKLYPHLAKLAPKYLVCQASSVASEKIFSTAGDIVTDNRARLDPESVEALVFLKKKPATNRET